MLKVALEKDDYKFILVSESTVPIKSFDYIYNYLTKDTLSILPYQNNLAKTKIEENTIKLFGISLKNGTRNIVLKV